MASVLFALAVPVAHAGPYTGGEGPKVGGRDAGNPAAVVSKSSNARPLQAADSGSTRFAVTGADIMQLSIIGAGAIVLGVFLKRRARSA